MKPISFYARQLRPNLPTSLFEPVRNRLAWFTLHLAIVAVCITLVARGVGGLAVAIPLSLVIGHSFAGMAFVAHETLHGAVVRRVWLRNLIGFFAFLPFMVSPRLWVAWHNKTHHGNTARVGVDPDALATLEEYKTSWRARLVNYFTIGAGRWAGFGTLALGFSIQTLYVLTTARRRDILSKREFSLTLLETLLGVAFWTTIGLLIGSRAFAFAFLIPLCVGNAIVMSYIFTNHALSPLTEINDPLMNSLTVTAPRIVELLHLNFGYHVEHHLFPSMSSRYAKQVQAELVARWPELYQAMPLHKAMAHLLTTPRVYRSATVLVDPKTGREWPTLPALTAPTESSSSSAALPDTGT